MDAEKREKSIEKTTRPILSSRTPSRTFDYSDELEHSSPEHDQLPVQTDEPLATSTSSDKPSYMSHTVCSLEHIRRDHSISRSNSKKLTQSEVSPYSEQLDDSSPNGNSKFGVELKRLNSNPLQIIGRRKSSSSEIPHIEEIFELELLEKMLETVIGYEQRRRIRSQIRIVKKQQPAILETTSRKSYHPTVQDYRTVKSQPRESASPVRKTGPPSRPIENLNIKMSSTTVSQTVPKTDQPSKVLDDEPDYSKRSPVIEAPMIRKLSYKLGEDSNDHVARISESKSVRKSSPNPKSTSTMEENFSSVTSQTSRTTNKNNSPTSTILPRRTSRSPSPKTKTTHTTKPVKIQQTSQKISNPVASEPGKPIWATQNILKKASETSARTFKTASTTAKKTVTKVQKQKTIENIEDCVTSSYGIGPTDEDGMPLFGIRALKKKSQPIQSTTKG